jgi:hypothetical protein
MSRRRNFNSADGTVRCSACGLHDDVCTCRADHPLWLVIEASPLCRGYSLPLSARSDRKGGVA